MVLYNFPLVLRFYDGVFYCIDVTNIHCTVSNYGGKIEKARKSAPVNVLQKFVVLYVVPRTV